MVIAVIEHLVLCEEIGTPSSANTCRYCALSAELRAPQSRKSSEYWKKEESDPDTVQGPCKCICPALNGLGADGSPNHRT